MRLKEIAFEVRVSTDRRSDSGHLFNPAPVSNLPPTAYRLRSPASSLLPQLIHSSLLTTMIYLHLTDTAAIDARKVINDLFRRPRPKPPEENGGAVPVPVPVK